MDAELIRKMELVKTEVQKHQNEMEASLNDFAKESLDGIEKKMKVRTVRYQSHKPLILSGSPNAWTDSNT